MANPVVGYVDCPHCGGLATVHREARGMRAMYYRCYDPDGMSMRCGTVQIRGPSGQIWIEENMREKTQIGGMEHAARRVVQDPPREDIPTEDIRREVESVKAKRRRSLLDLLPMGAGDE